MYPIKFIPILKSTIWGGDKIIPFKHLDVHQSQVGESWEISDVPGSESVVCNGPDAGKKISDLVKEYKCDLVGKSNYQRFGNRFPLLIKFIDACADLSIQVHPNDALAARRHHSMGKSEMWYVIGNNQNQAHLHLGLKNPITSEDFASLVENNTICDALKDYAVEPGDVFYIPAGRIHTIGAGCFLTEIQQTSDITYRIYDYNRKDKNGKPRELHTELAKEAIDYHVEKDYKTFYEHKKNEPVELVTCSYFTTTLYDLTKDISVDYRQVDSFVVFICMEGKALVKDDLGNELKIQAGESILFPALTQRVNVKVLKPTKILETYV